MVLRAAANKRSRNAHISHNENPSNSDAVQFFLHTLTTDSYNQINLKQELYAHLEQLLYTLEKPLKLTDRNFAAKVNPMRKYPDCTVNTGSLFDEDGDPIFNLQVTSTSVSPVPTAGKHTKGAKKTGSSLKRSLGTSSSRSKKSLKTAPEEPVNLQVAPELSVYSQVRPPIQAPPPPPLAVNPAPMLQTTLPPVTTPARKQQAFLNILRDTHKQK